jgi:hypothetical protein
MFSIVDVSPADPFRQLVYGGIVWIDNWGSWESNRIQSYNLINTQYYDSSKSAS